MKILSALILVFFLAFLPSCKFFQNKVFGKKARALAEMKAREDSTRVADSLRKAQAYLLSIENARQDSIRLAVDQRKAAENKYNIIVGSFITPEYAREMAQAYKGMGYNPEVIKMNERFELVSAEGHQNLRTAIKRLAAFQDTVQMESWIYVRQ
jgi:hypothetical protein